jgi:hypothetical protein
LFVTETVQPTSAPPPFPDPLHWSTVTGRAEDWLEGVTVHTTRNGAPPPLPEPSHWVMSALVVEPVGKHNVVGPDGETPPAPELLHWLIVTGATVVVPVMLFTMWTAQVTVAPPPLPDPSHWVIEVMSWLEVVVVVMQVGVAPAAPWQSLVVTVELVAPVTRLRLFVTVTSQATAAPPTLSEPLHWLTEGGVVAAPVTPRAPLVAVRCDAAAGGTACGLALEGIEIAGALTTVREVTAAMVGCGLATPA